MSFHNDVMSRHFSIERILTSVTAIQQTFLLFYGVFVGQVSRAGAESCAGLQKRLHPQRASRLKRPKSGLASRAVKCSETNNGTCNEAATFCFPVLLESGRKISKLSHPKKTSSSFHIDLHKLKSVHQPC